jgi:hypothetical protein
MKLCNGTGSPVSALSGSSYNRPFASEDRFTRCGISIAALRGVDSSAQGSRAPILSPMMVGTAFGQQFTWVPTGCAERLQSRRKIVGPLVSAAVG